MSQLVDQAAAQLDYSIVSTDQQITLDGKRYHDAKFDIAAQAIAVWLGSYARLASAAADILSMPYFSSRYCWNEEKISRSTHLRFCWDLFLHTLYNYREKKKYALKQVKECVIRVELKHPVDFKLHLAGAEKLFKKQIRERGNKLHEWAQDRQEIMIVEMHELGLRPDNPDGHVEWYAEARADMLPLMKDAGRVAVEDFEAMIAAHETVLGQCVAIAKERHDLLTTAGFTIEPVDRKERQRLLSDQSFWRDRLDLKRASKAKATSSQ
jgi:hypothetical protein